MPPPPVVPEGKDPVNVHLRRYHRRGWNAPGTLRRRHHRSRGSVIQPSRGAASSTLPSSIFFGLGPFALRRRADYLLLHRHHHFRGLPRPRPPPPPLPCAATETTRVCPVPPPPPPQDPRKAWGSALDVGSLATRISRTRVLLLLFLLLILILFVVVIVLVLVLVHVLVHVASPLRRQPFHPLDSRVLRRTKWPSGLYSSSSPFFLLRHIVVSRVSRPPGDRRPLLSWRGRCVEVPCWAAAATAATASSSSSSSSSSSPLLLLLLLLLLLRCHVSLRDDRRPCSPTVWSVVQPAQKIFFRRRRRQMPRRVARVYGQTCAASVIVCVCLCVVSERGVYNPNPRRLDWAT